MTISLLRRIWKQILAEPTTAPRQRLTGFEPLEPRMVLSGFAAHFAPDYFSPPPGDFSHINRSGAEVARPAAEFGAYSDYNVPGRGLSNASPVAQAIHANPRNDLFETDSASKPLFADQSDDDLHLVGSDQGGWNVTPLLASNSSSIFDSSPTSLTPYASSIETDEIETESELKYDSGSSLALTVIDFVSTTPQPIATFVVSYTRTIPVAVDKIFADAPSVWSGGNSSVGNSSDSSSPSGYQTFFAPPYAASPRSITERDYTQVNAGGAVERPSDIHDYATPTHGSASDASLAVAARPATTLPIDRGGSDALLASQSSSAVNSATGLASDAATQSEQASAESNQSADHEQNGLLGLTEGERLKLKRKLAGLSTEIDEATSSSTGRNDQHDRSDTQVAYDPTRPFDAAAIPDAALRQPATANISDDGLIELLAVDTAMVVASGQTVDLAAANRQVVMEPAAATYQAFETIVAGGSQNSDGQADAARLAAAVAMSNPPVVQAE